MKGLITDLQQAKYDEFCAFAASNVVPSAEEWDRNQRIPRPVIDSVAERGYFGCILPREYDGQAADVVTFGLLNEAFGRASSALTGVFTVQAMVSMALLKWGTSDQKHHWLPTLATGKTIAAFALTEPGGGSAINNLTTRFENRGGAITINGRKRWISCAQFADLFLVFGMLGDQSLACLVPRTAQGLQIQPITDLMGFRAAGLGELHFDNVEVPSGNVVGRPGFALSHVAPVGLHYGRISTACSASGLLRGCFEESTSYAATRRIGDRAESDFGMVRSLIARMGTDLEASRLLCLNACRAEDDHLAAAYERTLIAKYFTSRAAVAAASDAVQLHGAAGCHSSSVVSRYYRDAKIMEIIEGTTQIHEDILGKMFVGQARRSGNSPDRADA